MDRGSNNNQGRSSLCIFCWSYLSGDTTELDCAALAKYFIFIERYFENWNKTEKILRIPELANKKSVLIGACEKCGQIVKGFSNLYQEMKSIELKLNWKLDSLKTIVGKAERNDLSNLKLNVGHGAKLENQVDKLVEFRNKFVEKCSLHFKHSYPKLTLKRCHRPNDENGESEKEAATNPSQNSELLTPTIESSNAPKDRDESKRDHKHGSKGKIEPAKTKSIVQKKRPTLSSRSKPKSKKPVEFKIRQLDEWNEMVNNSDTATTSASAPRAADCPTNCEFGLDDLSRSRGMAPGNIRTTPGSQVDQEVRNTATCEHEVSSSNLKSEIQPSLFDDEDNDNMSIDTADPLADCDLTQDGNSSNNDDDENDAANETTAIANHGHCNKEISISETFLVKRELGSPITSPLKETTSSSRTPVKVPLKFSPLVSNEVLKKMDTVTENTKNNTSDESPSAQMPENESVSRFRRRFKCSQCTLTFTSEGSLESHLTSAHVQRQGINDKDHFDGKSESQLEIDDVDDYAFSFKEGGEHDDSLGSERDSNFDIDEEDRQSEADDEFDGKPLKSELQPGNDEAEIEASESLKKKSSQRINEGDSESVRDLKCEKCEPWSRKGEVPWHIHLAKHRYLHTNGQEALRDKNLERLNIKWSDLKLEIDGNIVQLKEEFTAPGCGRKFALEEHLDYHLKLHGKFNCANADCQTTTCCFIDLVEHEIIHSSKRRITNNTYTKCIRCKFQTDRSGEIFRHYLAAHVGDITDMRAFNGNYCRICKLSFGKFSGCFPMPHFLNFHDLSRIEDPSKVHRCEVPDCPAYFLTVRQLKAHYHKKTPRSNTTKAPSATKKKRLRPNKLILANIRKTKITEEGLTLEDFVSRKGAEFKCDETSCNNAAFFTEEELNIHRKLHGDFKCNFCETVENYAPDLCRHELEVHSKTADEGVSMYAYAECARCVKTSQTRVRYIVHHLAEHLGLESDTPRCLICGVLYFAENKVLEERIFTHFKEHHDLSTLETTGDDAVWRCKKENCKAYFLSRLQLSNHVKDMHWVKTKSQLKKYPCVECGKTCKTQITFSKHMLKFHSEEYHKFFPFPCEIDGCIRRCETEISLRKHLRASHPIQSNQHLCPVCGKYFKQLRSLHGHMVLHDEEYQKGVEETKRKHQCDQCGKTCKDKTALEKHKLSHSGPESWTFICEVCSKKCITKQKLEEHLRTHTKEKPFKCDHCGASYAHRHNWRIHVQKKHGVDVNIKVYKKVNDRIKAKYVKKVGDGDGQGSSRGMYAIDNSQIRLIICTHIDPYYLSLHANF